jgi:gluconolactonase
MKPHRLIMLLALSVLALAHVAAQEPKAIPGIGPTGPIVKLHTNFKFTEGPAADKEGNVYFSDIPDEKIYKASCRFSAKKPITPTA